MERIEHFRKTWEDVAPAASFAGMTLEEFVTATEAPIAVRAEIQTLKNQQRGKVRERAIEDDKANLLLELVVNSVRGTPGFGSDCPLYRALGYVPKSERRSGLVRPPKEGGEGSAGDADAA